MEAREAARGGNGPAVRDEDKGLQAHNVTVDRCPIEGESLREFQGRTNPIRIGVAEAALRGLASRFKQLYITSVNETFTYAPYNPAALSAVGGGPWH